jgi:hypothetical protein
MIAVVCTMFPSSCCNQIYHYTTTTSFSLFVQDVVCTVSEGGGSASTYFIQKSGGESAECAVRYVHMC